MPTTDALALIANQRTITLATGGDSPWAAPVYYYFADGKFYFFSKHDSRHIVEALAVGRCASSIYRDSDDWRDIEGLQMQGAINPIGLGSEALKTFAGYVKKFPTVSDFFAGQGFDLDQFTQRFRTRLYAFVPTEVFYLNNHSGLKGRQLLTWVF